MSTTQRWAEKARKKLIGRRITSVRYMTDAESNANAFDSKPLIIELDDGNAIFPVADDEGNGGGALYTTWEDAPIFPVMR